MGGAFGNFVDPGEGYKEGTTLKEIRIDHLSDAHDIIGMRPKNRFTPVVLVPTKSFSSLCCIPCFFVQVPAGFSAIVTKFGGATDGDEEDGTWSPGFHTFWCCCYEVEKLVSKQMIVFDTPVKDCKTKDAITVQIDVLIVFEIIRAKDFVYQIGPERFDDLLRASQDECLRQMANETLVEDIYDLQSQNLGHMIDDLNSKFERYGVNVVHFTIKNVKLPHEMAKDMEDKTLFDTKDTMNAMKQKFDQLSVNNAEGKQKLAEECTNKRRAAEQKADMVSNLAVKETSQTVAQSEKEIAELESTKEMEVKQLVAEMEFRAAEARSQILVLEREVKSQTTADLGRFDAEAGAYSKQRNAEADVEVAQKMAHGKRAMGEAEGASSQAIAARRQHESELSRLNILQELLSNKNVQIATTQENTIGMNAENNVVTAVTAQGLEALRAKLAEMTAGSLQRLDEKRQPLVPRQQAMR